MKNVQLRNFVGGVTTAAVLSYVYLGSLQNTYCPETSTFNFNFSQAPEEYVPNSYYSLINDKDSIENKVATIHKFVTTLINNIEDINPQFSGTVDKHFWDLA